MLFPAIILERTAFRQRITPLSITSVSPESNAGDTAVSAVIQVIFGEDMSLATQTDIHNFGHHIQRW